MKGFLTRQQRSLLAQLRAGILPLRIETGRFNNIKDSVTGKYRKLRPDERLCEMCKDGLIEDEFHFVCVCSIYKNIRDELYCNVTLKDPNFCDMNNLEKFNYLLNYEYKLLSDYLVKAWNKRKELLYT